MNHKQLIVQLVQNEFNRASDNYRDACIKRAAMIASANAWDDFHKDDGVGAFSQNPYNLNLVDKQEIDARNYFDKMKETLKIAIDTFLA